MSDADKAAESLLPETEEFVQAVTERDPAFIQACVQHTGAYTLAVLVAELLATARDDMAGIKSELRQSRRELATTEKRLMLERTRSSRLTDQSVHDEQTIEALREQLAEARAAAVRGDDLEARRLSIEVQELRADRSALLKRNADLQAQLFLAKQETRTA